MKNFTITIPDNKESIFVEMMKSLSFVQKIQAEGTVEPSEEQKQIALKRLQQMEENPEIGLSWEDIESKIKI